MSIERFTPQEGQVVTAQGHTGTFKVLDVSADGQTADIQPFSLSKQMPLGAVMKGHAGAACRLRFLRLRLLAFRVSESEPAEQYPCSRPPSATGFRPRLSCTRWSHTDWHSP
jgi:hypothetical protein